MAGSLRPRGDRPFGIAWLLPDAANETFEQARYLVARDRGTDVRDLDRR